MVDYPEACLLCLLRTNYACPVCMASKEHFSVLDKKFQIRTVPAMQKIITTAFFHISKGQNEIANKILKDAGLRGQTVSIHKMNNKIFFIILTRNFLTFLQNSLWKLPLTNVYSTITPDMLHQIKKGVWEHLVRLTLEMIKSSNDARMANLLIHELDIRISLVPRYYGLRQFPKGISSLSQITAAEYQQLMKVL